MAEPFGFGLASLAYILLYLYSDCQKARVKLQSDWEFTFFIQKIFFLYKKSFLYKPEKSSDTVENLPLSSTPYRILKQEYTTNNTNKRK